MFGILGHKPDQPYAPTGTTAPIYVPRDDRPKAVRPGQDYFLVQIHNAQAAFTGPIWENVRNLIIASQVNLNQPKLGNGAIRAIQRSREVKRHEAVQLGLSPNLIQLVPATMTNVSISIDFILDKQNALPGLGALINSDSFLAVVSLAPGAALVAKTISGLAQKIIETFVPAEEREPILQFSGDFNIVADELKPGYYVILGTRDPQNPLPPPGARLDVQNKTLLIDGQVVTQMSYVILEVMRTEARTRYANDGAPWDAKLREAEDEAERVADNPLATQEELEAAWKKCQKLIEEAQILLRADPSYTRSEARKIVADAANQCRQLVATNRGVKAPGPERWKPDMRSALAALDLPAEEDLPALLDEYADQVVQARRVLKAAGLA